MLYLGLVYLDEKRWFDADPDEWRRLLDECIRYGDGLRQSGKLLAGSPLHPTTTATTLRKPDGHELVITDGPFAETKEVLGGYHLFDCKDLDEAITISADWPGLKAGMTIELRPVYDLE